MNIKRVTLHDISRRGLSKTDIKVRNVNEAVIHNE